MTSDDEQTAYDSLEMARLFDQVVSTTPKIKERYEEIWQRVSPHWVNAKKLLDIGTGPARLLGFLALRLPHTSFIGLDVSDAMLTVARENLEKIDIAGRVKLLRQDCTTFSFADRSISGILSTGTWRGWSDPRKTLKEIWRMLVPGGYCYIDEVYYESDWKENAAIYGVERFPKYKERWNVGMRNSPRRLEIETALKDSAITGARIEYTTTRCIIEIMKPTE